MFLWIDPWIRKLWYALIDENMNIIDAWVILQDQKKPTRKDQFARMVEIFDFFEKMIDDYPVQAIWIEKLFFTTRNQNNAEHIYWVRGSLCMLFARHTLPIHERTPQTIKQHVTWNWAAGKELMLTMITKVFEMDVAPERHDTADALGIAWMVLRKIQKR